jgi:pyruvate kinase
MELPLVCCPDFRCAAEIEAVTNNQQTYQKLALSYGVRPYLVDLKSDEKIAIDEVLAQLKKEGVVKVGETIVFVHGKNLLKESIDKHFKFDYNRVRNLLKIKKSCPRTWPR